MIEYITGELVGVFEDGIIIDHNGIGYKVMMPNSALDSLPDKQDFIKVHAYLHVREDILALYGFLGREDLDVFKLLITVSGIGPKVALGILSAITPNDLSFAILSEDVKTMTKAPGVGVKTAKKLILELKDKIHLDEVFEEGIIGNENLTGKPSNRVIDVRKETVEALVVLGYSRTDASKVIRKINIDDNMTSEEVLKLSLKQLI